MNLLDDETYVDVCSLGKFANEREDRKELVSLDKNYVKRILKDDYEEMNRLLWVLVTEDTAEKHYEEQTVTGFCVLEDADYEFPVDAEFYELKLVCSTAGGGLEAVRRTIKYAKAKAVANIPSFMWSSPSTSSLPRSTKRRCGKPCPTPECTLPLEAIQ